MQKEQQRNTTLKRILGKLRLKELELIEKISTKDDDYIIRVITDADSQTLIALNGDWERVSGYTSAECLGEAWYSFAAPREINDMKSHGDRITDSKDTIAFDEFSYTLIHKNGHEIKSKWKSKYYKDIDATVSIGRVHKADVDFV